MNYPFPLEGGWASPLQGAPPQDTISCHGHAGQGRKALPSFVLIPVHASEANLRADPYSGGHHGKCIYSKYMLVSAPTACSKQHACRAIA
eukprot:1160252-Pelagomonas_calceolata.AAC.4